MKFNFFKDYLNKKDVVGFKSDMLIKLECEEDGIKWYTLERDLIFNSGKRVYTVPKEVFETDLATIPKCLRWIYKPNDDYSMSATLHDWLYDETTISRLHADWIFLLAMKSQGVHFFTRWVFFASVRLFGGRYR
jgi:hypothetical protein